ncbi:hypothetical protein SERLA73DRAFT_183919 [Serpula lacrymans var. lacrymans S7.3]|uniref:Uncharacterized protein n=2 Tax=Serpula lacrymans var. lacrymans TaxID=341189 RepID=F8Q247_SERL3|nr:uncharacterized protein SERLADRAFT_471328 [Serpula lacrymans var. lacrymans S7.9]EGN97258.1 hypothetical protein SERLA73DRAFT_183919 [Serpula lacrymans var. lacrymans S7.3]EGO22858.1 hypothetical protein SERLADRAFT_471328 [Serpula lacrymans var. lacrymans S7.9]
MTMASRLHAKQISNSVNAHVSLTSRFISNHTSLESRHKRQYNYSSGMSCLIRFYSLALADSNIRTAKIYQGVEGKKGIGVPYYHIDHPVLVCVTPAGRLQPPCPRGRERRKHVIYVTSFALLIFVSMSISAISIRVEHPTASHLSPRSEGPENDCTASVQNVQDGRSISGPGTIHHPPSALG